MTIVMRRMIHALHDYHNGNKIEVDLIKSFADVGTRDFWETGKSSKNPPANLRNAAKRKLQMIDAAVHLQDLKVPPGNKLHPLDGDRIGQHAIWINDQYRICFRWQDSDAYAVEIVDYH